MTERRDMQAAPRQRRETADVILLKDLTPRKAVRGGKSKRLFGERHASEEEGQESREPFPATDL